MEYNNLLELIKTVSDSNISSFKYEDGETKILMSSGDVAEHSTVVKTAPVVESTPVENIEKQNINTASNNDKVVKSPLVGTFYVAPNEEAAPFVNIGDKVETGQVLAIVEAMKLMNEIESDFSGTVSEIFVNNGEAVEYGQPLFAIC